MPKPAVTVFTLGRIRALRRWSRLLGLTPLETYFEKREEELNWQRKKHLWPVRRIDNTDVLGDS